MDWVSEAKWLRRCVGIAHYPLFHADLGGPVNDCATGLTLHDLAGNLLVDFTQVGERDVHDPDTDHWVGCTVQLDPGAYRLRLQTPVVDASGNAEILEQIVVTSAGWQMQVFLLRRLVWRDDKNPMLGIYGAHQLVLSGKLEPSDLNLLRTVTITLQGMIGAHPDVLALDAFLDDISTNTPVYQAPGYRTVYQAPPMLRSSWNILVNASIVHPEIVRAGSLASYVADSIWGDGTWLVWQGSSPDSSNPQPVEPLDASALRLVYTQIVTILGAFGKKPIIDFVKEHNLSNLERFLLEYVALSQLPMAADQASDDEQSQAWVRENLTTAKLVRALHVPSASIGDATASLVKKLKLKTF